MSARMLWGFAGMFHTAEKKQPLTGWLLYMFLGIRYAILFTAIVKRETFLAALFL